MINIYISDLLWLENYINPVVRTFPPLVGEYAGGTVSEHAVNVGCCIYRNMQRSVVHSLGGEVVLVGAVVPNVGMIGGDINRVGSNSNRGGKIHLLPPGGGFTGESCRCQTCAGAGPEVGNMGAGIGRCFVEADAGNITIHIGTEFHTQFH